jgi:TRAP-type transport system periplasmic protein
MLRRRFLEAAAVAGAAALASGPLAAAPGRQSQGSAKQTAAKRRTRIIMGGYSPASTGFSVGLKMIGDRLQSRFGDEVDIKYVYNILDLGYRGEDIVWLVESGVLTLGYQSSSYFTERVPDVGVADLPFLFTDPKSARAAIDGRLGSALTAKLEAGMNLRIAGYFENGFRHVSNRLRPIRTPADMKGMTIRVLPSQIQARTFELLGANPKIMDLTEAIDAIKAGKLDAQENPFANTVTYGVHKYHRFHSATNHFYLSRPIFVHRPTFDSWPRALQDGFLEAVRAVIPTQRDLHEKEEVDAMAAIRKEGGEILELTEAEHRAFATAVAPVYDEARAQYGRELMTLVNR